jgi:predicted nucleic acid-binding protein
LIYIDTSVIVKLYFKEDYSREASDWLKANNEAIPLTKFHEIEFINAIQLKQFRNEIKQEESDNILSKLEEHEKRGIFFRPLLDWSAVFNNAISISRKHTSVTGSRSLDILHVAAALTISTDRFLTLDEKQSNLAANAGLKIEDLM